MMDKLEKILDMIDHRDKYSDEEIRRMLQDEECRKLYQTMQEVDSALVKQVSPLVDIDEEWNKFEHIDGEIIDINITPTGENERVFDVEKRDNK